MEEMFKIGLDNKIPYLFKCDDYLARKTAKLIIKSLPPVGWVRLHDATIDGKACYAFMLGKRNTPPERVSPIISEQLCELFEREPQPFIPGEEQDCWSCDDQKLVLGEIILTRRRDKITEYE
ncbi:hypothetical protein FRC06_000350 [Ceratobasidium sp. 370]|nr:hypothetical protein FRC06_000350 [Ceratobasidium sp. 370]